MEQFVALKEVSDSGDSRVTQEDISILESPETEVLINKTEVETGNQDKEMKLSEKDVLQLEKKSFQGTAKNLILFKLGVVPDGTETEECDDEGYSFRSDELIGRPSSSRTYTTEARPEWDLSSLLKYSDNDSGSVQLLTNEKFSNGIANLEGYSTKQFVDRESVSMSTIQEGENIKLEKTKKNKSKIPVPIKINNPPQNLKTISLKSSAISKSTSGDLINKPVLADKSLSSESKKQKNMDFEFPNLKKEISNKKVEDVREPVESGSIFTEKYNDGIELIKMSATDLFMHVEKLPSCRKIGRIELKKSPKIEEDNLPIDTFIKYPEWTSIIGIEEGITSDLPSSLTSVTSNNFNTETDSKNYPCRSDRCSTFSFKNPSDEEQESRVRHYTLLKPKVPFDTSNDSENGDDSQHYELPWVPSVIKGSDKYICRYFIVEDEKSDDDDWICKDLPQERFPPEPEYVLPGQVENTVNWQLPYLKRDDDDNDSVGPFSEAFEPKDQSNWYILSWEDSRSSITVGPQSGPTDAEVNYLHDSGEQSVQIFPRTVFESVNQLKSSEEWRTSSSATSKTSRNKALRELSWSVGSDPDRSKSSSSETISTSSISLPQKPPPPDPSQLFDVRQTDNYLSFGDSCKIHKKEKKNFFKALMKIFTGLKNK